MNRPRLFSFVTLVAVAGCSAQADTTYRGEALVRLHGTVVNTSGQEPPPLDAALVWGRFMLDNSAGKTPLNTQQVVASKIAVTGQFPNSFTMQVMTPPPNDVMVACAPGDPTHPARFAVAAILGLRQGADDANVQASDIFGNAPDFLVVYSDADLARDDCPILSPITSSGFSKGYHLLQALPPGTKWAQREADKACRQAHPSDAATACEATLPDSDFAEAGGGLATPIALAVQATPIVFLAAPSFVRLDTSATPSSCLPQPLARDALGNAPCRVVMGLPLGTTCEAPGLGPADARTAGAFQSLFGPTTVCELAQIPASAFVNDSCAQSTAAGWCYVSGPGVAAPSCPQGLLFSSSGAPRAGAIAALTCDPQK
jgi:hypothetical protein